MTLSYTKIIFGAITVAWLCFFQISFMEHDVPTVEEDEEDGFELF